MIWNSSLAPTSVLSDARLQERVPSATRATVTSVRSFHAGIIGAAAFGMVGLLSNGDDPSPGLLVGLAALIGTGLLVARWLPDAAERPAVAQI